MAILQLVGLGACCPSQQLVAETDAHAGANGLLLQEGTYVFHRLGALLRVARTIGQEQTGKVQLVEVVVPWYTDYLDASSDETADDVGLYATVHEYDSFH